MQKIDAAVAARRLDIKKSIACVSGFSCLNCRGRGFRKIKRLFGRQLRWSCFVSMDQMMRLRCCWSCCDLNEASDLLIVFSIYSKNIFKCCFCCSRVGRPTERMTEVCSGRTHFYGLYVALYLIVLERRLVVCLADPVVCVTFAFYRLYSSRTSPRREEEVEVLLESGRFSIE